ncbi:hypothetical protein, partial [Yoonia sp.]|uniref:hypothetical protein n=1 Tax=Yoonia sp. TaxID=2212373 RepID=UPI003976342A
QISGRMTALNQGMARKACQLWSGETDSAIAADLRQSMQDYEGSLRALTDGLSAMGILPPHKHRALRTSWPRSAASGRRTGHFWHWSPQARKYRINSVLTSISS